MAFQVHPDKWDASADDLLKKLMQQHLDAVSWPSWMRPVVLKELSVTSLPDVSILNVTDVSEHAAVSAAVRAKFAVELPSDALFMEFQADFDGHLSVLAETELAVNYPTAGFMHLPVRLGIRRISLFCSGGAVFSLPHAFVFIKDDFRCDVVFDSVLGDARTLRNADKLEAFLKDLLTASIRKELCFPNLQRISLAALE
jgi:hypothetical protein